MTAPPDLHTVLSGFIDHLAAHSIEPAGELIPDGVLHRCHVVGHPSGTKNLAYTLHIDEHPAGWFQEFRSGVTGTWKADVSTTPPPAECCAQVAAARERRDAQRQQRHAQTAALARSLWERAIPCLEHEYLTTKRIRPHGARIGRWPKPSPAGTDGALLIPLKDAQGAIWNLQAILSAAAAEQLGRNKDFLNGGRKQGLFTWLGKRTDTVLIAEGFATAASLHEATNLQTFVAFDAGNLLPVATTIREHCPDARLIICGDDDRHTPGNPGATAARRAAEAVGGLVSLPVFPPGAPGSDWNDAARLELTTP